MSASQHGKTYELTNFEQSERLEHNMSKRGEDELMNLEERLSESVQHDMSNDAQHLRHAADIECGCVGC